MKKLGNKVIKALGRITALLILCTAAILLYPKYSEHLGLEEKVNEFATSREVETTVVEESAEVVPEEHLESKEESEEIEIDTLSKHQQDEIHDAFLNIISTMHYDEQDVLFYTIKTIDNNDFYAFQIIDPEDNTFEYLLLSDVNTGKLYWCDNNDDLGYAYPSDVLYATNKDGNKEVDYEDKAWKPVFKSYMKAMLENMDNDEASSYVDTSYFYETRMSEKDREHYAEDTLKYQEELIKSVKELADLKEKGRILSYSANYKIVESEEMVDESGESWMDVYIHVTLSAEKKDEIEEEDLYYMASLYWYDYGWRIATFNTDY